MSICNKFDERPFRSKADKAREARLQNQYRRLAIPAVVAALQVERCTGDDRIASPFTKTVNHKATASVGGLT